MCIHLHVHVYVNLYSLLQKRQEDEHDVEMWKKDKETKIEKEDEKEKRETKFDIEKRIYYLQPLQVSKIQTRGQLHILTLYTLDAKVV